MFKKIKDKLAEEMKQSPARLQAGMQQLAQDAFQAVSPAISSSSIQDLSLSNDNFSLTEETDTETPRNSPAKHGFQSVNLSTASENCIATSRRSSVSSSTSDASFLFPLYESPATTYHLQSDMDQSASEVDDNISSQLDRITKDQLYMAYRNVQTKHRKYRDKYRELALHYREIQRNESKLESLLVETQDKAFKRIGELKEQCQLEKQAKAHLEEALRNDIEEKECLINSLNTKIALLQKNGENNDSENVNHNSGELLIDLTNENPATVQNEQLLAENEHLKMKVTKMEALMEKMNIHLKRTKENLSQETDTKLILERDFDILKNELDESNGKVAILTAELETLKKREEEAAISLAENKLSIYRELEGKEEQIKMLTQELKSCAEIQKNLTEALRKSENELEQQLNKNEYGDIVAKFQNEQSRNEELSNKLKEVESLLAAEKEKRQRDSEVTEKLDNKLKEMSAKVIVLESQNENLLTLIETEKLEKKKKEEEVQMMRETLKNKELSFNEEISLIQNKLTDMTAELEEKRKQQKELTAEHDTCKTIVNELKTKISDIMSQVSQLLNEKETQSKKLKEYKNSVQLLQKDFRQLMESTKFNINQKRKDIQNLNQHFLNEFSKFDIKSQEIKAESDNLSRLKAQNEKQMAECANLKREWEIRTSQVHQLMLLIEDLEKKQQNLVDDNKMLCTTLQTKNMRWLELEEEYKTKILEQLKQCEMIRRENATLLAELAVSNKQETNVEQDVKTSVNRQDAKTNTRQAKQGAKNKNHKEVFSNVENSQQVIENLNAQVNKLQEKNKKLSVENATLQHDLNVAIEEKEILNKINAKSVEMYSKLEELRQSQSDTISSLESKILHTLKDKQSESESSDASPCQSMDNLDSKAQHHGSKKSKKLEELKISENKRELNEKMSIENVDLAVSKKIEKLLLEKEAADTENLVLKQKEKELNLKMEEVEVNNNSQKELILELRSKLNQINSSKDEIDKQMAELVIANEGMIVENKHLKDKENELLKKHEALEKTLEEKDNRISDLENMVHCLELENKKWKNSNAELETLMENFQSKNAELEKRVTELQNTSKEVDNVKQFLEERNMQLVELNKEVQRYNEAMSNFQMKLQKLETENAESQKRFNEQRKLNEELTNENKLLKNKQNEIIKTNEQSKSLQDEQVKINQELNTKIMTLNSEKNELTKKINDLETEFVNVTQQKINLEGKVKELMEESAQRESQMRDTFQKQILELQKVNESLTAKNANCNKNITTLNHQVEKLKQENTESLKRIRELEEISEKVSLEKKSLKDEKNEMFRKHQELESANKKQNETITDLDSRVQQLLLVQEENDNLKMELEILKTTNEEISCANDKLKVDLNGLERQNEQLQEVVRNTETELQTVIDDNKIIKMRNAELTGVSDEVEQLRQKVVELQSVLNDKVEEVNRLQEINKSLSNSIEKLNEEKRMWSENVNKKTEENESEVESLVEKHEQLEKELELKKNVNKQLEAQLDETLVTFQTKESQMKNINEDLKKKVEELKTELAVSNEEHSMRLKQLAKEFQAQLHDKEEELQAALEKRFDQQQTYESELIRQYKEQLKDFQVELTTKSEQIENLILENKDNLNAKQDEINKLLESIDQIKKSHSNEIKDIEKKWKTLVEQKTVHLEAKHEQEINELTNEWQHERKTYSTDPEEELESTSRVAMAAVQSNTGSFHTLQQTLLSQKRELMELRKLVKLRHETLEDSTEIEYLRNILFEYMMGKETLVLAKVIAAVVKFDREQTSKIIKKEEDKLTLLGSLGLT